MATLEEYYAARDQRDRARAALAEIARQLESLARTLRDQKGVRLHDVTAYAGPPPNPILVDRGDLASWERLEPAIRAFTLADDAFRRIDSNVTPDQRRHIGR